MSRICLRVAVYHAHYTLNNQIVLDDPDEAIMLLLVESAWKPELT